MTSLIYHSPTLTRVHMFHGNNAFFQGWVETNWPILLSAIAVLILVVVVAGVAFYCTRFVVRPTRVLCLSRQ